MNIFADTSLAAAEKATISLATDLIKIRRAERKGDRSEILESIQAARKRAETIARELGDCAQRIDD